MDDSTAVPATEDPIGKVAIKVRKIEPAPVISSTSLRAVKVSGDMIHQGLDVGDATLTLSGSASELLVVGELYQFVRVSG
jgi:hypothetical protein